MGGNDRSYTMPATHFDGLNVTRRASFQFAPPGVVARSSFETLATKGGLFMVVTALRSGFNQQMLATEDQCFRFRAPGRDLPLQMVRSIVLSNVATHLSTFPVS